jgi:hypothetical protein
LDRIPEAQQPVDQVQPQLNWLEKQEPNDCDITAYTDGSKLEEVGTGCGWALTHEDQIIEEESIPLGKSSTVFQAELIAIQAVLLWLKINLATLRQKIKVENSKFGQIANQQLPLSTRSTLRVN